MKHQETANQTELVMVPLVYSTKRVKLSWPQCRMLLELSEPNRNKDGTWYFPRKNLSTLRILESHGLAVRTDSTHDRFGYRLTKLGKDYVRALEKAGVQP